MSSSVSSSSLYDAFNELYDEFEQSYATHILNSMEQGCTNSASILAEVKKEEIEAKFICADTTNMTAMQKRLHDLKLKEIADKYESDSFLAKPTVERIVYADTSNMTTMQKSLPEFNMNEIVDRYVWDSTSAGPIDDERAEAKIICADTTKMTATQKRLHEFKMKEIANKYGWDVDKEL